MKTIEDHIQDISEIKKLMERSSKFISLSGLSGISAGIIALTGASIAFFYLNYQDRYFSVEEYFSQKQCINVSYIKLFVLATLVLLGAIGSGIFFTSRRALAKGIPVWDNTTKRLLIILFVPIIVGGIFCLIMFFHKLIFLIAPSTMLFYGLALLNASKYTYNEIRYLGFCEIILGLLGCAFFGYGLIIWAIGFGILHIIYGIIMYYKYERNC